MATRPHKPVASRTIEKWSRPPGAPVTQTVSGIFSEHWGDGKPLVFAFSFLLQVKKEQPDVGFRIELSAMTDLTH